MSDERHSNFIGQQTHAPSERFIGKWRRIIGNKQQKRWGIFGFYLVGILLITLMIAMVFQERLSRLDVPLTYGAKEALSVADGNLWRIDVQPRDGTYVYNQVDLYPSLAAAKSFIANGSFSSTRLNFPDGYNSAGFPNPSSQSQFLILKFLSFFSNSSGMVLNLYWFFSIAFTYSVVFMLLQRFGGISWFALVGSVTFALSPAVYGREPLFSQLSYTPIVACLYFIFEISKGRNFRSREFIFGGLVIGSFSLYGAIFSLIVTLLVLLISLCGKSRRQNEVFAKFLLFQIASTSLLFYFSIRSSLDYWKNEERAFVLTRSLEQIENWPFRLIDSLVMPNYSSFIPSFLQRSNFVPTIRFGEGVYTFGPYGFVAIAVSIYYLLRIGVIAEKNYEENSNGLRIFSSLLVLLCLFSSLGGLLPAISGIIDFPIKSWERMEVVVSLVSLVVFSQVFTNPVFRRKRRIALSSKSLVLSAVVVSVGIGFLSAQPIGVFNNGSVAISRWDREHSFFQNIDTKYPNINLLQLPKMQFPEGPPIGFVAPYSDFIPYFHSDTLRLAAGEITNGVNFNSQYDINGSFIELIKELRKLPFDGAIIDLRATSEGFRLELNRFGSKICADFHNGKTTNYVFCKFKE